MINTEGILYTVLSSSTLITSHTTDRIYPIVLPQRADFPAITYERVYDEPVNGLSGFQNEDNAHMEIDVFAWTFAEAKELKEHVHQVIDSTTALRAVLVDTQDLPEIFENNQILYRTSMEFSCWNKTT